MKKYCLTDKAKNQLGDAKDLIMGISIIIVGIVTAMLMLTVPVEVLIEGKCSLHLYIQYYSFICWFILIAFTVIVFKRWIQNSLEEC